MQQPLPFTVLKLKLISRAHPSVRCVVATALTVYGIETPYLRQNEHIDILYVATVLTVYGIETRDYLSRKHKNDWNVATAPIIYGMRRMVRGSRGAR